MHRDRLVNSIIFNPPLNVDGGYVFIPVCLSVSKIIYNVMDGFGQLGGQVECVTRTNLFDLGENRD